MFVIPTDDGSGLGNIPAEEDPNFPEPTEMPGPGLEPITDEEDPFDAGDPEPDEASAGTQPTPAAPDEEGVQPPEAKPEVKWQGKYQNALKLVRDMTKMTPAQYAAFKAQVNAMPGSGTVHEPDVEPEATTPADTDVSADSLFDLSPADLKKMIQSTVQGTLAQEKQREAQARQASQFFETRDKCDAMIEEISKEADAAGNRIFSDEEVGAIIAEGSALGLDLGDNKRPGNPQHYARATEYVIKQFNLLRREKGLGQITEQAAASASDKARSLNNTLQPPSGAAPVSLQPKSELDIMWDGIKANRPTNINDLVDG